MNASSRPGQTKIPTPTEEVAPAAVDIANIKARRDRAMAATFGLFKEKNVFPEDGLQFEREMREE